ncbi:MAG: hypothetical protein ACI8ZM_002474 [Crocinitomix sp.]|jgi:hypothetical protein
MGGFTTLIEYFDGDGTYPVPDKCLKLEVVNRGKSQIFINDSFPLEPGESKTFGPHDGKHFKANIKYSITNSLAPYEAKTHVSFESEIEII